MALTPRRMMTRRAQLAGLAAGLGAWAASAPQSWASRTPVITLLGDSISAGLGLAAADALPAQLAQSLGARGLPAQVRGAAVSGDTTADALERVDFSIQADTDLVLVALGGNDLLQGIEPRLVQANLIAILRRLKARRIPAILAGMRAPPVIGRAYAREFDAVFPAAAKAAGVPLYPFLLDGVAGDPRLNQKDGVHPNAAGVRIIAARLAPVLARALKGRAHPS